MTRKRSGRDAALSVENGESLRGRNQKPGEMLEEHPCHRICSFHRHTPECEKEKANCSRRAQREDAYI